MIIKRLKHATKFTPNVRYLRGKGSKSNVNKPYNSEANFV